MLHSEAHVIDRKAYDDILDYIIKRSTDLFGNLNISADIVNQTFMRLLKTDPGTFTRHHGKQAFGVAFENEIAGAVFE